MWLPAMCAPDSPLVFYFLAPLLQLGCPLVYYALGACPGNVVFDVARLFDVLLFIHGVLVVDYGVQVVGIEKFVPIFALGQSRKLGF